MIALDTERVGADDNPVLVQFSAKVGNNELNAVVQLFSRKKTHGPSHVFEEGFPL